MKKSNAKRLLTILILTSLLLLLQSNVLAAPDSLTSVVSSTGTAYFQTSASVDINLPLLTGNDSSVLYGMDYTLTSPSGTTSYSKDSTLDSGIKNILQYGYPVNNPQSADILANFVGITEDQMRYATAAAIQTWSAKQLGTSAPDSCFKTYAAGTTTAIAAKTGYSTAYNYFAYLYKHGSDTETRTPYITASSLTCYIYLNSSTNTFSGTLPFTIQNCSEPYTYSTSPTAITASPGSFDTENRVIFNLSLPKGSEPSSMSITVTANDYGTNADLATYTNSTSTISRVARVAKGTTTAPTVTVPIEARAVYNTAHNISKTDSVSGAGVSGATIAVYNASTNSVVFTGTSNASGQMAVSGLTPGNYYYKETAAPVGYSINTNSYSFTILEDGSWYGNDALPEAPKSVTNEPFYITKTNSSTGAAVVDAYLAVYNSSNTLLISDKTTSSGLYITGLEPGTYTFKELQAPSGYDLNTNTYTFTVDATGTVTGTKTLTNTPSGGGTNVGINEAFYIEKTDASTGTLLSGALFSVYDSSSYVYYSGETTTNGRLLIPANTLPQGTYTIYEDIAPTGYVRSTSGTTITVQSTGVVRGPTNGILSITNTASTSTTSTTTANYVQVYIKGTTTPVQNVQLSFSGSSTYTAMTDANGKAYIANLTTGSYTYKTTQVPNTFACSAESYSLQKTGTNTATGTLVM